MDNTFPSTISSASSVLVLLPTRPTFDQVAAGLSLYLSFKGIKEAAISSPSAMTVEFNRLIGVDKISQELGNKNLTIRFKNYLAENIERVSADVDGQEFKLTVIPKVGQISPTKDQVELSSSGVSSDLVILIGGLNESHFPAINSPELKGVKTIHVGLRPLIASPARGIMSFSLSTSSVSEVASILIREGNLALDSDIATNLLAGIEEGSNNFAGQGVTAETFETVADLLRSGGKRPEKLVKKDYPQGAIPGQNLKIEKVEKKENVLKVNQVEEAPDPAPKDWFEPKIYKGTSIN